MAWQHRNGISWRVSVDKTDSVVALMARSAVVWRGKHSEQRNDEQQRVALSKPWRKAA